MPTTLGVTEAALFMTSGATSPVSSVPAMVPAAVSRLRPVVGAIQEGVESGGFCAAQDIVPIWSATKSKSAVENAFGHWKKHAAEFPELINSKQYVETAKSLVANPPADALTKARGAEMLIYDQATNTFLVRGVNGAPKTMFRPKEGINYWNQQ
ncbi:hypothetical protein [Paracidovorax anthurii]|uniref:hypothetical protein n=1 Tax=Paracidovorax anthurii TaxID=78229 RepID=UPI001FE847F9|nr:hypothetical protein [Paracidovorax anthurii]